MEGNGREYFLDALRAFVVVLVVILHVAVSYVVFPGWVQNPTISEAFWIPVALLESCVLMSVMFFLAGYFTLPSIARKGPAAFEKGKLLRIGVPYLLGILVLAPALAVISTDAFESGMSFPSVMAAIFSPRYYSQYHFWFLGVLLLFFSITAAVCARPDVRSLKEAGLSVRSAKEARPGRMSFTPSLVFVLSTAAACFVLNLFFPSADAPDIPSRWTRIYILQFENVKMPLYIGSFLLGMHAYRRRWFRNENRYRIVPRVIVYAAACALRLGLVVTLSGGNHGVPVKLAMNLAYSVEIMAFLQMLVALFRKYANKGGRFSRIVSSNSYAAYLVHLNVLFLILLLTRSLVLPLAVKWIAQAFVAALTSWGLAYALRKIPVLSRIL